MNFLETWGGVILSILFVSLSLLVLLTAWKALIVPVLVVTLCAALLWRLIGR